MPEKDLLAVPDAVSDEVAAQFLINPATGGWMLRGLRERASAMVGGSRQVWGGWSGMPIRLHWGRMPGP